MKSFGLIGYPLTHSLSARYFEDKFAREGIDASYSLFPIASLAALPELIARPTLAGLNVTSPYKEKVIPMLDSLSDAAAEIGAVNVIAIDRTKSGAPALHGYNSDAAGFDAAFDPMLRGCRRDRPVLVLGTGGAAKAAAFALRRMGFGVLFVSRTAGDGRIAYTDLSADTVAAAPAIVQATPLGMLGHAAGAPPIPYDAIRRGTVCIDLIYNPSPTLFMQRAEAAGAVTAGGLAMLHAQAEAAWRIWTNRLK